ncbi:MAG: surface-adhesin E family protein [Betaproteobacteria bacterium]
MKLLNRITLAVSLCLFSTCTLAEWVEIEKFEDGMRVYVDQGSARRSGDLARVEHLVRWAEPQLEPGQPAYLSTKVKTDYDCAEKREKYASSISYSGAMGNGARIAIDDNAAENWSSISPSTMEEKLWLVACNAK